MAGFVRRFTSVPTLEVIRELEGLIIVDLAPPAPATGAGTGTVLLVGEFEDGYFATDAASDGSVEVYGSGDYKYKFGGFGYTYNGVKACHPSARRTLGELWNGNGWLKSYKLKAGRLVISRVDTSVGSVTFSPLPTIKSGSIGPWALTAGMILSATTNTGTGTTAAIAATAATVTGTGGTFTMGAGDSISLALDGNVASTITFSSSDTSAAACATRINTTVGATIATVNSSQLVITSLRKGTSSSVGLANVTSGTLAKLGLVTAVTNGTGNVANLASVTSTEVAGLINASASMTSAAVKAVVSSTDSKLWLYNTTSSNASTIQVDAGTGGMAAALGFVIDVDSKLSTMDATTIPAGTRLQASTLTGSEWVTMQSLDIPAGAEGPFTVRVRPGLDDGTHIGAAAGAINTIIDAPAGTLFSVTNAASLSAALTEAERDARYISALDATLNELGPAREANYLLIARRSNAIVRAGRDNVANATEIGLYARKYISGEPIGTNPTDSISNVGNYRRDRVFYSPLGLKVTIPQIAERGTAGGVGFTATGTITVRPDGPLTTLCASLPPEENPGQQTNLIDDFFAVDSYGAVVSPELYKAFRRAGLAAPKVETVAGTVFQSGITTSLNDGEQTMARRRFADFVQDSAIAIFLPYAKRLNKQSNRDKLLGKWNGFLSGLKSPLNAEKSRLYDYSTDDSVNAGNTPEVLALGVYYIVTKIRMHPSMDFIVLQTEIGENTVITKTL